MMGRVGFMDTMNRWKWRVHSHQKLWQIPCYKISLTLELWGETKVITSKSGGSKLSTSEGNNCL